MINIDKSKLVLINNNDTNITDKPLETKQVGYYRDAWNRFVKNKVSLIAFIIICILFFFVIFGPIMKKEHKNVSKNDLAKLSMLPPKSKIFSKLGFLNGTIKYSLDKNEAIKMAKHFYGKDIIKSGMPKELLDDDPTNDGKFESVQTLNLRIDYYKYIQYKQSYMFTSQDKDVLNITKTLNKTEYEDALKKGVINEVISVNNDSYIVTVKFFEYVLGQTPEETYFWFGTNIDGNDLFITLWKGARISLLIALAVVIINAIIGLILGAISGYYGGTFDLIFGRFVEILSGIPFLAVLTLLIIRFGTPVWVIVLAFTITGWIGSYSMARMQFYRFKNREYILAARSLGASDGRIMLKHIFPNAIGYMLTSFALAIPSFVFQEASYSFLKIINYKDALSVGMLIQQGQSSMNIFPHALFYPAFYVAILMIAFNLFGNGLRDAFNPSLRGVE